MSGKITVETDIQGRKDQWHEFIESSTNGTIFHRLDFLDYHPEDRFEEHPIMFYYGGQNLLGVLPLAFFEEHNKTVAKSPYGGSYGGIVISPNLKFRYAERMLNKLMAHLREIGVEELQIRPAPREQHQYPTAYPEFHLSNKGFDLVDRELTNVVDLRRISNDRFDIYERSCRSKVRKAEREGVEIEEWSSDWQNFHEILRRTQARHGKEPTHTQAELEQLSERFPDRIRLSMAYHEETPIAGALQFILDARTSLHFYNCHITEYRDLAPVNSLIDREVEWSRERGLDFLDLGTTIENYQWNDGLVRFKESFGATGHFRDVYRTTL